MVSIDAAIVLSGALLTAFVGTTGLVKRLALDRCLPQSLLKENQWRHTSHRIIIAFFLLCASILWITQGHVQTLAGVYTMSLLGVMALFAIGNIFLKIKRSELPRHYRPGWLTVLIALAATLVGLIGNVALPTLLLGFLSLFPANRRSRHHHAVENQHPESVAVYAPRDVQDNEDVQPQSQPGHHAQNR
jgi:amino acid transporter